VREFSVPAPFTTGEHDNIVTAVFEHERDEPDTVIAPAVLEDQLRAHPLISQAMVVGDARPFVGALITIDPEAFEGWKQRNSKPAAASVSDLVTDPDLIAEVDAAVKQANLAVSHAESIRKFRILPVDFTEDTGELTPTMKVKRKVVAEKFAHDIEAIYAAS
jgi:long-chain acyl-CoA synthetase